MAAKPKQTKGMGSGETVKNVGGNAALGGNKGSGKSKGK